jgi:hypothetical protein
LHLSKLRESSCVHRRPSRRTNARVHDFVHCVQSVDLWHGTIFDNNTLQIATTTTEELCLSAMTLVFQYDLPDFIVM